MNNSTVPFARAGLHEHATRAWRPGNIPWALFSARVLRWRLPVIVQDSFQGQTDEARMARAGTVLLLRSTPDGSEVEAAVELPPRAFAFIDAGHGHVGVEVAAGSRAEATAALATIRNALAVPERPSDQVSFAFWMSNGQGGGSVRHRPLDAPAFPEIAANYSAPVRAELERLLATRNPDRGRLILWRGPPGTGKSHALRALTRAWAQWCSAHFIMDPEELLGRGGSYLLEVLAGHHDGSDGWRLLVLEDAGDLIASDARSVAGQGLSRLLNVADGILGQGTKTLLLITTNEPVGRLHPAVRRPGRCLCDLEFLPLSADEANRWLTAAGQARRVTQPTTLAELYGGVGSAAPPETPAGFGFARALTVPGEQ